MTDITRRYGPAAIGGRLRRLSESIDEDARVIYAELNISFQQRWVGLLEELSKRGPRSVGELAETLGIRHSSVSQTRRSLEEEGLVEAADDPDDARSRRLRLSPAGKKLVQKLEYVWDVLNQASVELDQEAGHVVAALDRLDAALRRKSLYDRVHEKFAATVPQAKRRPVRSRAPTT
jgi:DNA-binding MarR family transcriptional regulator